MCCSFKYKEVNENKIGWSKRKNELKDLSYKLKSRKCSCNVSQEKRNETIDRIEEALVKKSYQEFPNLFFNEVL